MKKINCLLIFILTINVLSAQTPSVNADEEAIKKVIVTEFDAFVKRDFKTWADTYVDASSTTFMVTPATNPGALFAVSDFQKISKSMKGMFDAGAKSDMTLANRDGWIIRVKGDMAFAIYNEEFLLNNGVKIKAKTQKVMEKVNGKWKIATTSSISDFNNAVMPTPNPEEEAIKKVVIAETDAYCKRDFKAWADTHIDASTTTSMMTPNGNPGSMGASSDFQKMSKGLKRWMEASPQSEMQLTAPSDDWICRINGNMASISYNEYNLMVKTGAKIKSRELRVLEKIDGQWKISAQSSIWDFKNAEYGTPNLEEEAIKTSIINETEYWLDRNLAAWSESFVHEPYLTWTVTNGGEPGDVLTMRGWEALKIFITGWFESQNKEFPKEMRKSKMTRDQWQIQIRGNVAYVSYNQHSENEEKKTKSDTTETRVLEKANGKWKIAMQATLMDFKDATPPIRSKF